MKNFLLLFSILFGVSQLSIAQQFTDSNLPIIIINTDGAVEIPDYPRVLATMKIIYRGEGQRNYLTDKNNPLYLNYSGRIDIEVRGSSSQYVPKKQYGLTTRKADNVTNDNVSLLGLPTENDWILNSMAFEPSCIRDYLSYNLSRQIGEYATRTVYCEVVLNGDYRGLYVLQEKIKADDNRVDVMKITTADNTLPNVSGGYITKADKTNGDPIAWTMQSWFNSPVDYIHELPKPENVTTQQNSFIYDQFQKLEQCAAYNDVSPVNGYPAVIDIPSFIDFMLINELASNPDAYQYSTYFHKDRNGKLRAGPIWDINLSYGNDLFLWGYDRSKPNIWQFQDGGNDGSKFWRDLYYNTKFKCYLSRRWNELILPGQPLNLSSMESFIDQTVTYIREALVREQARWGTIGDHQAEIEGIKAFLATRIQWITANLGSYYACSNITVPSLVISKIMYNPPASTEFPNDDDLEYIEITNNGSQNEILTGVYFSGTGLVYQFPALSTIGAHKKVILASNAEVFKVKYGFTPFGQFTRHLSNSGQKIVLADAFGNVIDSVHYKDDLPWPDADNNGYHLELTDLSSDNALAVNWVASNTPPLSVEIPEASVIIKTSPNPVTGYLRIESTSEITSLRLYNLNGNLIYASTINCETADIDMSRYSSGIYILKVETANGSATEKIIKQ